MDNRFSNIFNLTEDNAIALIAKPLTEADTTSERYVGVCHLVNFPTPRSIRTLIEVVKDNNPVMEHRIARRKAVEVLGRLKAKEALPTIIACLNDADIYTVENAVWAIGEIGTEDRAILEQIAQLLTKPGQNYRTIIQTLGKFNYQPAIDRIKVFAEAEDKSIASSAIATIAKMTQDNSQMERVVEFLQHEDVNARRACVQELIDTNYYPAIEAISVAPISIAFRLRGIGLLGRSGLANGKLTFAEIEPNLDRTIRDRPQDIALVHEYDLKPSLEFLIGELYHTDFGRCYLACKTLLEEYSELAPTALRQTYQAEAHNDYGAHFHVIKLFGLLKYRASYDLIVEALHNTEPQFQKSRAAAAIALANLGDTRSIPLIREAFNTPIFDLKYACLLALEQLGDKSILELAIEDNDSLIQAKAKKILDFLHK
jgi:bilin biosynthesis protein